MAFALTFKPLNHHHQHLEYLIVNPENQGIGLGKNLLNHVCQIVKTTTLDCENNMIPYYEKYGFTCTANSIYYKGKFLRIMQYGKKLSKQNINILKQILQVKEYVNNIFVHEIFMNNNINTICQNIHQINIRKKPP